MPLDEFKTQVLLLHSDQHTLDSLGSQFGDRYTVHYATSGSQALSALAEVPINVIISAHDLPGMTGLEALREAKKRSPETLGILLAGAEGEEVEALVGDNAVFEVIHGNVDDKTLLQLVETAAQQVRLATLAESANDTAAKPDDEADHIIMETGDDGASIISQSSARLRALNPKSFAASAPVDILVLTTDEEFLETIRSSTGSRHEVHTARTLAQADEIIRSRKVGVAVVDAAIVRDKIEQLTQYLRREAPRLVPVVAGRRDDGEMLMDLINRGKVYRFLLKPVSPGRARLAVEASVKHHTEAPDSAFSPASETAIATPAELRPAVTAVTGDLASPTQSDEARDTGESAQVGDAPETVSASVEPSADTAEAMTLTQTGSYRLSDMVDAANLTTRERDSSRKMLGIGVALAVVVLGALLWFGLSSDDELSVQETARAVPAVTEADSGVTEADAGSAAPVVDDAVERALQTAEAALLESRLRIADAALQQVAEADPNNARLPFLMAQLVQAELRLNVSNARDAIREGRFEDAADAISAAGALDVADTTEIDALVVELDAARSVQQTEEVLALANARLESGELIAPANSNARYYFELVLKNDPENAAARQGLDIIANRLVLQARGEIDNGKFDAAQELLYAARALDSTDEEMIAAADALQSARKAASAAAAARKAKNDSRQQRKEAAAAKPKPAESNSKPPATAPPTAASTTSEAGEAKPESEAANTDQAVDQQAAAISASDEVAPPPQADAVAQQAQSDPAPASLNSLVRTRYVSPKFPRIAVRRNLSGWVDLMFTVSTEGTVKDVVIRDSEPGDVFVRAATRAVEQWQFEPVLENGVAIEKQAAVRMMFALD